MLEDFVFDRPVSAVSAVKIVERSLAVDGYDVRRVTVGFE